MIQHLLSIGMHGQKMRAILFVRCISHIVVHGYNDGMEEGWFKVAYPFVQMCEACLVSQAGYLFLLVRPSHES
jgi:hypothetical protein